jgi:hypothetical protein
MLSDHTIERNDIWKRIWRLEVPERVRGFVWIVLHRNLMTNERNSRTHLSVSFCDYCRKEVETTLHVLRDCAKATSLCG